MPVAVLLHGATSFYKTELFEEIEEKFCMISPVRAHDTTVYLTHNFSELCTSANKYRYKVNFIWTHFGVVST